MFPSLDIIKQVLLSWQVIAVCIAFLAFWSICSAITNPPKKRIAAATPKKVKKIKRPAEKASVKNEETEDLGLGE